MRCLITLLALSQYLAASVSQNGLIDHFDANTGLTDSANDGSGYVTAWQNQGVAQSHISVSDTDTSVVAGRNGNKMVRFSNANNNAGLAFTQTGSLSSGFSMVAVVRIDRDTQGASSIQRILQDIDGEHRIEADSSLSVASSINSATQSTSDLFTNHYQSGDTFILTVTVTPTSLKIYADGHLVSSRTTAGSALDFTNAATWEIGNSFKGDLGSLLIYDSTATLADLHTTGLELAKQYDLFYGTRIYVDAYAFSSGDGSSWGSPYQTLDEALSVAVSPAQIWLKEGVHVPRATGTFTMKNGLSIVGGFSGDRAEREPLRYRTVLSGNVNDTFNDGAYSHFQGSFYEYLDRYGILNAPLSLSRGNSWTQHNNYVADRENDNAGPVVTSELTDETAKLSGVTITSGRGLMGAGLSNNGGRPVISDCSFIGNNTLSPINTHLQQFAGALFNQNHVDYSSFPFKTVEASLTLNNCLFAANFTIVDGGAIVNTGELIANNCAFVGNAAGLQSNSPHPYLSANSNGGAIVNSGILELNNCTFTGNNAKGLGGALYNDAVPTAGQSNLPSASINNCIFWNNQSADSVSTSHSSIYNVSGAQCTITNSIVQHSGGSASWQSAFGTDGGNNLDVDPLFFETFDPNKAPFFFDHPQLASNSPAVGIGNAAHLPYPSTDLYGNARLQDANQDGTARLDLGAYEVIPPMYVSPTGTISNTGLSWSSPRNTQFYNFETKMGQEVWIASGLYSSFYGVSTGAKFLGGFDGTETSLSERNFKTHIAEFQSLYDVGERTYIDGLTFSGNQLTINHASGLIRDCKFENGSGLHLSGYNDITLQRCHITDHSNPGVTVSTAGFFTPTLVDCVITGNNNISGPGGGILVQAGSVHATHCTIAGNKCNSPTGGAGIHTINFATAHIDNSIIWGNYDGTSLTNPEVSNTQHTSRCLIGNASGSGRANLTYDTSNPNDIYSNNSVFEEDFDVTMAPIPHLNYALASDSLALDSNSIMSEETTGANGVYAYGVEPVDINHFEKAVGSFVSSSFSPLLNISDLGAAQYQDPNVIDTDGDGLSNAFEAAYSAGNSTTNFVATSDDDGDGMNALMEFALGSNPTVADTFQPLTQGTSGQYATITFKRNKAAMNFTEIVVERSTDMGVTDPWTSGETTQSNVSSVDTNTENVTHRSMFSMNGQSSEFLRISVQKK